MKTLEYRIFETPDKKTVLAGVSNDGELHPFYIDPTGDDSTCKKILRDIELGVRDPLGCKIILEKKIEVKEAADIH